MSVWSGKRGGGGGGVGGGSAVFSRFIFVTALSQFREPDYYEDMDNLAYDISFFFFFFL